MTVLKRISRYYNPLCVVHNEKCYELDAIKLYDESGVIVQGDGWFGSNNNIENELIINGDTKKINRDKLNYKTKYNMIVKEDQPGYKTNTVYTLYIHADNIETYDNGIESNGLYIEKNYYSKLYDEIQFKKILLFKHTYTWGDKIKEAKDALKYIYGSSQDDGSELDQIIEDLNEAKKTAAASHEIYNRLTAETYKEMYEAGGERERKTMDMCKSWKVFETDSDRLCIELYNNQTNIEYNDSVVYDLYNKVWIN